MPELKNKMLFRPCGAENESMLDPFEPNEGPECIADILCEDALMPFMILYKIIHILNYNITYLNAISERNFQKYYT